MFKKVLIIISLITITTTMAYTATTGNLTISGTVPEILEISVISAAGSTNLDLTQNITDLHIGDVIERSNVLTGYTVSISSANAATGAPHFKSSNPTNADTLDYTLKYNGAAIAFAGGSSLISDVNSKTATLGSTKALNISYDGTVNFLNSDTYSDTLTFTIAAK
ncbi:MAG: hypothetical protein PF518_19490 [Spirochaetaceae bacterium]|jgi:hypothetical protein|nr:hypothetical protein [Spirochaetaceae bacterium]